MTEVHEWARGEHVLSDDRAQLDLDAIHAMLARSYWSPGIARETVRRGIEGSLPVGLYRAERQVGFARAITDGARFAYLCDVFLLEEERGRGLGRWMVETLMGHPAVRDVSTWLLATRDAHGVYAPLGFTPLPEPERYMVRRARTAPPPEEMGGEAACQMHLLVDLEGA